MCEENYSNAYWDWLTSEGLRNEYYKKKTHIAKMRNF